MPAEAADAGAISTPVPRLLFRVRLPAGVGEALLAAARAVDDEVVDLALVLGNRTTTPH